MYAPIFPPVIGGPSTQCFHLCRALLQKGETPVVVTIGDKFEKTSENGYTVYRYPWRYTGTSLDRIIRWAIFPIYFSRILRREKPDILHCHSVSVLAFVAGFLAKRKNIPRIIKFAGDWVWETLSTHKLRAQDFEEIYEHSFFARFMRRFERWGLSQFDIIWAPSQFRASNIKKVFGDNAPIRIIPNALMLQGGGVRTFNEGDVPTIVSANRFIPHKRIPMIIRAFSALRNSQAKLVLIGSGEEAEIKAAVDAANDLGVEERVRFTGRLGSEDVYKEFALATLYVSGSLEEGFPNVFIEAMHWGLPIVSTDVGGCKEMILEGETGYLVDAMDEKALTERMERIISDAPLRNRLAEAAFTHSKQFDLSNIVESFTSLYQELLTNKS